MYLALRFIILRTFIFFGRRLEGALAAGLGALAEVLQRCLRCHSSHSSSLTSLLLLGWLGWFFWRLIFFAPVAVALAAAALASTALIGVAITKQKMEELQGAAEDPLQHKEQLGGLIGALHTR